MKPNKRSASLLAGVIGIGIIAVCVRLAYLARESYYMAEQHGQPLGWQVPAQITGSTFAFVLGAGALYLSYRLGRKQGS